MKFKPIYLYGVILLAAIVTLVLFTHSSDKKTIPTNIENQQMPQDDVHKNLGNPNNQNPNRTNVSESAKIKLDELKKGVDENPGDTVKIREYADFLAAAHQSEEAIQYYNQILAKNSKRKDILFKLTFIYYNQGDLNKSEDLTNQILKIDKNDTMALYNLGALEATRGNKEKAREIWNKLINDFPNSESATLAKNSLTKL